MLRGGIESRETQYSSLVLLASLTFADAHVQVNLIGQEFREPLRREHDETSTWERQRFDAGQSSGWRAWDD
jgi:hypothetical protein